MFATRWALVIGVLFGLELTLNPAPGWAEGCCMCTQCSPPPAVYCTDSAHNSGDCYETCEGCAGPYTFDRDGTCGVGAFAACAGTTEGFQAPALGWLGMVLVTGMLLAAGFVRLARRPHRTG